jgi:hypothetical protein
MENYHTHKDEQGKLHKCYHRCKNALFSWQLWLGMTISFPFEHALYENVWPFKLVLELISH